MRSPSGSSRARPAARPRRSAPSGGSYVVAIASGADGEQLAEVRIEGLDGYSFTANFLSWAAIRALRGEIEGAGAIGPAQAFGLEAFERGVSESGIKRA